MAEQKEENERAVYKSTLEEIIEKLNQRINRENPNNKIVIKGGDSIGILEFNKGEEKKAKKLYCISMTIDDGKDIKYIYDETGDNIARVTANNDVFTDDDIQLDREKLLRNMDGIQNDNQGRHIADKQEKVISVEEKQQQKNDIENNKILNNLVNMDISVDSSAAIIDLYRTIYNGRRLKDLLGIDEKLINRMPQGANIEHMNYLGIVNSDNLTAKDGKSRNSTVTCVIMDDPRNPKHMVELDESILKARDNLSKQENITADQTSQHLGDAEIKKGASTTTNTRQISTFEVPDAGGRISQPNDLITLEIRQNPKYIDESTSQRNDAHNVEFYLGIQDKSKSENDQKHGRYTQSVKLEAYDETARIEEFNMREEFRTDRGVDDEFENIKGVNGIDRGNERDANELNRKMAKEQKEHEENVNKQYKSDVEATSETANQVNNERQHYLGMAWDIVHDSDVYGGRDVKFIYNQIMNKKAEMEKNNEKITDEELKNRVQQDLENQRTPGDMTNPRRVG